MKCKDLLAIFNQAVTEQIQDRLLQIKLEEQLFLASLQREMYCAGKVQ